MRKFDIDSLYICPPSCSIIRQQYYSYKLQIIYVISEKKQTVTPLPTTSEKCHHTTL